MVNNVVGGHIEVFVPNHNVLHANTTIGNAGLAAADIRGDLDVF
jgi:hypothetical protein